MMRLFLLGLAIAAAAASKEEMIKKINKHNWDVRCWGKQNVWKMYVAQEAALAACGGSGSAMPLAPLPAPVTLPLYRQPVSYQPLYFPHSLGKRHAGPHTATTSSQQELTEFLGDWFEFRADMGAKIGNLSCVMQHIGMLTPTGQVNIDFIQRTFWEKLDLSSTLAGQDPEFRAMMTTRVTDCYDLSNAMSPSALLRLNPLINDVEICRKMVFFKCAMKVKTQCCAAAQLLDVLETKYGKDDGTVQWAQYGLPGSKYELAAVSAMVLTNSLSPVEEFVDNFFNGESGGM